MEKLGLGVLGLGEGRSIISAGMDSDLYDVVELCDINEELCKERCAEFNLTKYTTSLDELLANQAVDVVGIYTPDHVHAEHVIKALNAGKHVICTKPFLDDLSRAREVLDVARQSGKLVMVGQSSRFFTPYTRQRDHFLTGDFGDLITVEAFYHADHRWFLEKPWAKKDTFKWLYGGISHPIDLVRWYMPDIAEVMGYAYLSDNGRELGLVHPDTHHFILKSTKGLISRVSGAYSGPTVPHQRSSGMSCILRCAKGASHADYPDLRYAYRLKGQSIVETYEDQLDYYFRFEGHHHHAGEYQNYIEYFARCLESGENANPDAAEGIVTVALMQAMEESTIAGQPIKVQDVLARYDLAELVVTPELFDNP